MVAYKDKSIDPIQGPTTTVNFHDPFINRSAQILRGVLYAGQLAGSNNVPYVVKTARTGCMRGPVYPTAAAFLGSWGMKPMHTLQAILRRRPLQGLMSYCRSLPLPIPGITQATRTLRFIRHLAERGYLVRAQSAGVGAWTTQALQTHASKELPRMCSIDSWGFPDANHFSISCMFGLRNPFTASEGSRR